MSTMATVKNRLGEDVVVPPKDEEELALEKLVFGDLDGFESNLKKIENIYDYSSDEEQGDSDRFFRESESEDDMFFIDEEGTAVGNDEGEPMEVDDEEESAEEAAWEDSDDERLVVSLTASNKLKKLRKTEEDVTVLGKAYVSRLRNQFEKIYPRPDWVDKWQQPEENSSDEDASDDETTRVVENDTNAILQVLKNTEQFLVTTQSKLIAPTRISISRLADGNKVQRAKSAIQSVAFHPTHPLLMTGGFDRTLRIYHIDGKKNAMVTSLHLRDSPVTTALFSTKDQSDSNVVFAGGRRKYMHKWDLNLGDVEKISRMYGHEFQFHMDYFKVSPRGTYLALRGGEGWCNILNGTTGQYLRGFKVDGEAVDFAFAHDESYIIIVNGGGEVWEYALDPTAKKHHGTILRKWVDDGGVGITTIALGGAKDRWLAIGCNNGLVSLYDRNNINNHKPFRVVENLVTSITSLSFTHDGQVLCISSRKKRDALKLVHLPSGTVYSNWPTSGTPLGRVTATQFLPNGQILAVGNEAGKVTLWRLNHY